MRLVGASVLALLIPSLGSAVHPSADNVDRQIDDQRLIPIAASSLTEAETTQRCKAFIRAVGMMDHIYQGGILDFEPSQLTGFAFARVGSPAFIWANAANDLSEISQQYLDEFSGLRNPADQWDRPLFKSDKATCLALYRAGQ